MKIMDELLIRPFEPERDMEGVYACYAEGFRHIVWPFLDHADKSFNMDILRLFWKGCTHGFVAEQGGEVYGVIFGSIPIRPVKVASMIPGGLGLSIRAARGKGMEPIARRHFFRVALGYAPHVLKHPVDFSSAEILLFTSRKLLRGRGMGRRLMDAFVEKAKSERVPCIHVCTDTALSWHFYEAYGFSRVREFPMKAYAISLHGQEHRGLIYRLMLE